jgi:trimethylamine:corrinoid methyltransferase-like protein
MWDRVNIEVLVGAGYCPHCGAALKVASDVPVRLVVIQCDMYVRVNLVCNVCSYVLVGATCPVENVSHAT